jgi:hypothetical protein
MKNLNKLMALTIALVGFSAVTRAQSTASASATATVVTPIAITKNTDMNFGNLSVLAPAGTRVSTSGVTLPATAGTVAAAAFTVTGSGTYTYAITLPSTAVTLTHSGGVGSGTMTATAFTSTPSGTGALVAGTQNITVGATLNVGAAQAAGVYQTLTAFDVTVNYN